jgi:CO dehydrogenase maturation factor
MTLSIAIAGKGGIGKTTLSALLVRALRESGIRPVLAVDADPNSNLSENLGVDSGRPLADIREVGSSPEGSPSSGIGRVRAVEDEIQRAITESDGFDLISMGRPEGPRCYCAVNNLLRKSLDSLSQNYAAIVVDNEAGMEHLSRRTTNNVDFLLIVANPTLPSVRAASRILALSNELPVAIGRRMLLINRLEPGGIPIEVEKELYTFQIERLPDVPQDDDLEREGSAGHDVFLLPMKNPALLAVRNVVKILCCKSRDNKEFSISKENIA